MTTTAIPRAEYPRPQFVRNSWRSLNGTWSFKFDDRIVGVKEKWYQGKANFPLEITVPFCYQSELSGIEDKQVHECVWYEKTFTIPDEYAGKRVILHFGAVDYECSVWVNGLPAGKHRGGFASFSLEISDLIAGKDNRITVMARDYLRDLTIPRGKQYWKAKGEVMWFTNMTGIWQSVWLEFVDEIYMEKVRFTPHLDTNEIEIQAFIDGWDDRHRIELDTRIEFAGDVVAEESRRILAGTEAWRVNLRDFNDHGLGRWWSPETPNLYDVSFELKVDGVTVDQIGSYFGMRKISADDGKLCLNNRPYRMKLVLDQGYFPQSLLTAPTEEALRRDVELCKEMGFNGMRKHMMVADPRYLYWCDKLGVLVWGEMAAAYVYNEQYAYRMIEEWKEVIDRDYNHPSIVVWVPLNESWGVADIYYNEKQQHHAQSLYHITKSVDSTRLVISNDGWEHCKSDLCTVHDYCKDPETLRRRYSSIENIIADMPGLEGRKFIYNPGFSYQGEPVLCTEFGGVNYHVEPSSPVVEPKAENGEQFVSQLVDVIQPFVVSGLVQGYCYTQLTDTETEICGLLTWNREPKVPVEVIRRINEGYADF
ncbi:sugar-binding domain-containing protein [Paenibacillus sp. FSL R5-0527]|uniref:glycoside hydrolase family 2 protein n=1 Tax=Paenibacillus sp. FSL R5-0527 TaxID=2975321 RepID=UPI00097B425C|nr:glycoside hydrolase family 2 [Paenibacillus macerans]